MKVLILKPSSLGDVVQALPLLRLLKQHRPDAEVHWWLASELCPLLAGDADLAELLPHVDSDDILEFGLIPELVGRLPVISSLQPLGKI